VGLEGFRRFCVRHCKIQDKDTLEVLPFVWFSGQDIIAGDLVAYSWLWLLKGRQLGITWLIAAYVLWRITYHNLMTVSVIFQERRYAEGFIWRVKFMYDRLPRVFRKHISVDNKQELRFQDEINHGEIHALVGSAKAGRSITGDIVIADEAGYIEGLEATMQAVIPMLSGKHARRGQLIGLSTSSGPSGPFYDTWQRTHGDFGEKLTQIDEVRNAGGDLLAQSGMGPSGFKAVFLSWRCRTGRDDAWYAEQDKLLTETGGPKATKREHPNTPEEAFEYAAGRIYGAFHRFQHVGDIEIPTTAERYRAIDWGQTQSPFVCLWIAHVPGEPALLVSPKCPETIREMLAYRYNPDQKDEILKKDDHCPDCIRYAVVTYDLRGLVYVYRELYVPDPVGQDETIGTLGVAMHDKSGWVQDPDVGNAWVAGRYAELYDGTVADRSWGLIIQSLNKMNLGIQGHKAVSRPSGKVAKSTKGRLEAYDAPRHEVKEGIELVRLLVSGTITLEERIEVSRASVALAILREDGVGPRVAGSLERRSMHLLAQRFLKATAKRKPNK
jgi:hypothetical protein